MSIVKSDPNVPVLRPMRPPMYEKAAATGANITNDTNTPPKAKNPIF